MVTPKLLLAILIPLLFANQALAQEAPGAFIPAIYWDANVDKGVLLVTPIKMEIFDRKGTGYGQVLAEGPVLGVYMSPDGKKLAYSTSAGLWLVKLGTKETVSIGKGFCNYFSWDGSGSSFTFAMYAKNEEGSGNAYNIKLFWADGDGENLKQVYP